MWSPDMQRYQRAVQVASSEIGRVDTVSNTNLPKSSHSQFQDSEVCKGVRIYFLLHLDPQGFRNLRKVSEIIDESSLNSCEFNGTN
ncbi:MAG: hypothetical protein JWM11_4534 [Planctomycetaceae bacterium]|nr:hypothetical protein [Planctomycetaceae bacterium]